MKKFIFWFLAVVITLGAAYYQRKSGPTYPKTVALDVNGKHYNVKLLRSLGLNERPEVKLGIEDTSIKASLFYRRFRSDDKFTASEFRYKVYPVNSFVMNKVFGMTEEKGFFAEVPVQPPAGKIEYYIGITDNTGEKMIQKESPVVIRFKGEVPAFILVPHILLMFIAMLFSTLAGLMAIGKHPLYKKYSVWTLVTLVAGGLILGPLVQKYAFGELWTGIPFGWDLTDNKTLIAVIFWIVAVYINRKKEKPILTILASVILLLVFSIPHSLLGSELNYSSGQVTQGIILLISAKISKIS